MTHQNLVSCLREIGPAAIAVSGGIDSLTLACVAMQENDASVVFHAVSPAVPEVATRRVQQFAKERNWQLQIIDAGEFSDQQYRENPINRCFYCKSNLYGEIARLTEFTILSGTNMDDLKDFRPGLKAAENHKVRHPFVEAGINKQGIRKLASKLALKQIAELPASPCLSSRVSTGLRIDPEELHLIEKVESSVSQLLANTDIRCRRTINGYRIEIEPRALSCLKEHEIDAISAAARKEIDASQRFLGIAPYVRGSAFKK